MNPRCWVSTKRRAVRRPESERVLASVSEEVPRLRRREGSHGRHWRHGHVEGKEALPISRAGAYRTGHSQPVNATTTYRCFESDDAAFGVGRLSATPGVPPFPLTGRLTDDCALIAFLPPARELLPAPVSYPVRRLRGDVLRMGHSAAARQVSSYLRGLRG